MIAGRDMREIFQSFIAGDDAAFTELYRELNPRLSAYCRKLAPASGGPQSAEDIVQTVWERVIAMRTPAFSRRGQGVVDPVAFLFRTARNLIIDQHRRSKETRELMDEDGEHEEQPSDLECIVLDALEKLSFDDREVLVLNIYSGYKFGEIAEMQGKSADAIWARASRARARLREIVMADAKRLGVALPVSNCEVPHSKERGNVKEEVVYG